MAGVSSLRGGDESGSFDAEEHLGDVSTKLDVAVASFLLIKTNWCVQSSHPAAFTIVFNFNNVPGI